MTPPSLLLGLVVAPFVLTAALVRIPVIAFVIEETLSLPKEVIVGSGRSTQRHPQSAVVVIRCIFGLLTSHADTLETRRRYAGSLRFSRTRGGVVTCVHGEQETSGCRRRLRYRLDLGLQHRRLMSVDCAHNPIAGLAADQGQQPDNHEVVRLHVRRKRYDGLRNLEAMIRQAA